MSVELRRKAAERAFDRARRSGQPVDDDLRFRGWIDAWIAGDIEMAEVARRYRSLLAERTASSRNRRAGGHLVSSVVEDKEGSPSDDLETEIDRMLKDGPFELEKSRLER